MENELGARFALAANEAEELSCDFGVDIGLEITTRGVAVRVRTEEKRPRIWRQVVSYAKIAETPRSPLIEAMEKGIEALLGPMKRPKVSYGIPVGENAQSALAFRELRDETGLKIVELAAKLGVRRQTLSEYENAHRTPPTRTLRKIETVLGLPERDLDRRTAEAGT